jgi:hypothetical protein
MMTNITPEQQAFCERVANTRRQLLSICPDLTTLAVAMTSTTRETLGWAAGSLSMPIVVDETMPEGGFGLRLICVVSAEGEIIRHD